MTNTMRLERPQLLTELAFERIRNAIVKGDLKLGEQVSEAQLAQSMGISKTPVREALVRLKIEGLVDIHPQRGTFVFKLEPDQVGQLCRFRAMVESTALRESATNNQTDLVREMSRCVAEMRPAEAAKDMQALARIDMDFHWQFFAFCPNNYLRGAYDLIRYIDAACGLLREHVLENEARYRIACGVD
jgi:DNA-binding GntR family transcriptional regulator